MCEYCTTDFNVFKAIEAEEQDGGIMEVACNAPGLIVEINKTEALTFNVNYCPMCARDLKREESVKQISQEFHEFIFESITAGTEEIIRETNEKVAGNNIENRTTLDEVGTEYFYECMKLAENVIKSFERHPDGSLKELIKCKQ